MKIQKYVKKNAKQYTIITEKETLVLYDETILKYNLLLKNEIDNQIFEGIKLYDNAINLFYKVARGLKSKRKTELEVKKIFQSAKISDEIIDEFLDKYKLAHLIDDNAYLNAYIHDAIYLKKQGPRKTETDLLALGFMDKDIKHILEGIDPKIWIDIIDKTIEKKLKTNHTSSGMILKVKIASFIVHQGFTKDMTMQEINKYDFNNEEVLKREYLRQERLLSKKYDGDILKNKIKQKLYSKGYSFEEIDSIMK